MTCLRSCIFLAVVLFYSSTVFPANGTNHTCPQWQTNHNERQIFEYPCRIQRSTNWFYWLDFVLLLQTVWHGLNRKEHCWHQGVCCLFHCITNDQILRLNITCMWPVVKGCSTWSYLYIHTRYVICFIDNDVHTVTRGCGHVVWFISFWRGVFAVWNCTFLKTPSITFCLESWEGCVRLVCGRWGSAEKVLWCRSYGLFWRFNAVKGGSEILIASVSHPHMWSISGKEKRRWNRLRVLSSGANERPSVHHKRKWRHCHLLPFSRIISAEPRKPFRVKHSYDYTAQRA